MAKQDVAVIIILFLFILMCRKVRTKISQRHFRQQLQYKYDAIYNNNKRIKRYNMLFWNYFDNDDFGNYEYDREKMYQKIKEYFIRECDTNLNKISIIKKDIIGYIESYINYDIGNYVTLICTVIISSIVALFSVGKISYNDFITFVVLIFFIAVISEFYRQLIYDVYGDKRSFFILCKEIITDIEKDIIDKEQAEKEKQEIEEHYKKIEKIVKCNNVFQHIITFTIHEIAVTVNKKDNLINRLFRIKK